MTAPPKLSPVPDSVRNVNEGAGPEIIGPFDAGTTALDFKVVVVGSSIIYKIVVIVDMY